MDTDYFDYIAYCQVDGKGSEIEVTAATPEDAITYVEEILKNNKVERIRLADKRSGYFIRGFS